MRTRTLLLFPLLAAACLDPGAPPAGLGPTPEGTGPKIIFDLDAKPLPDIPFPNDLATRVDPTSPTGRRVNVSLHAPTVLESQIREKADRLTGFGIFSPITISFDAPVDLCSIAERHHANDAFGDDVVFVINVDDPTEPPVELDLGRGHFPLMLERRDYFDRDPGTGENLLLPDSPLPSCAAAWDYDRNTMWDASTNTLILRTVMPLSEQATYAVVVTRRLTGTDGQAVRSPFAWINHARQSAALSGLAARLPSGTTLDDVAFTWTFTTQDATGELHALRRGLYGHGPFAELAERFPPELTLHELWDNNPPGGNYYVLPVEKLLTALRPVLDTLGEAGEPLIATYADADYVVSGSVRGPDFLTDRDGIAAPDDCNLARRGQSGWTCDLGLRADDDETFDLDAGTGHMVHGETHIPFWCIVPKASRRRGTDPFPVAFYGHGYGSSRLEMLGFAGSHARQGIVTCTLDAYGHGTVIPPDDIDPMLVRAQLEGHGIGALVDAIVPGRARDLNNDGVPDSGGDFWSADVFHTRDIVRQSVIDHLVLLRVLRSFDGVARGPDVNGDGTPDLLGDFDGDGHVDLGGPGVDYHMWGQSLGGILAGVLAGVEPHFTTAVPGAAAGGLGDVGMRSSLGGVREAVFLPVFGPILVGNPIDAGGIDVTMLVSDTNRRGRIHLDHTSGLVEGDRVCLYNRTNGEVGESRVGADGGFRLTVAADALNPSERRARVGFRVAHYESPDYPLTPTVITDNEGLGDRFELVVWEGDVACGATEGATARYRLDTFKGTSAEGAGGVRGELFQGSIWAAGSPLIALSPGWGHERQTPDLRRFMAIASMVVEPGDPAAYARFYLRDREVWRARWEGEEPEAVFGTYVNVVNSIGDHYVPISTGIALARAAGLVTRDQMRYLIENYVVEGNERARSEVYGAPILFDPDNLSNGTDGLASGGVPVPRPAPGDELRATVQDGEGVHGMRLPYIKPSGEHGFATPEPDSAFDVHSFMANQVTRYFATGGRELSDDPCLADSSCTWFQ